MKRVRREMFGSVFFCSPLGFGFGIFVARVVGRALVHHNSWQSLKCAAGRPKKKEERQASKWAVGGGRWLCCEPVAITTNYWTLGLWLWLLYIFFCFCCSLFCCLCSSISSACLLGWHCWQAIIKIKDKSIRRIWKRHGHSATNRFSASQPLASPEPHAALHKSQWRVAQWDITLCFCYYLHYFYLAF